MKVSLFIRAVGVLLVALLGWQIGSLIGDGSAQPRNAILGIAIGAVLGAALAPLIISRPYRWLRRVVSAMPPGELVTVLAGLVLGLILAALVSVPLHYLPWALGPVLPAVVAIVCAYLGVSLALARGRDLSRFVLRHPPEQGPEQGARILVDTSAIIDGRIADVAETGFLQGTLVVPRFVLKELQHIADSADPLRRARGRRGLDILNRLQKDATTPVDISDLDARDVPDVDGKLVKLARQITAPVITNDFNLNRVAELQGVTVLNINQLANALKPSVLPGEEMAVHIIQEGKEHNQGVGYLDDGTMIVVENGRQYIDREVEIIVTRVLQTVAGRMIFAQKKGTGRD